MCDPQFVQHDGVEQAEDGVLAPMPSARESAATAVKPGLRRISRRA
jgi:hypothetical protein